MPLFKIYCAFASSFFDSKSRLDIRSHIALNIKQRMEECAHNDSKEVKHRFIDRWVQLCFFFSNWKVSCWFKDAPNMMEGLKMIKQGKSFLCFWVSDFFVGCLMNLLIYVSGLKGVAVWLVGMMFQPFCQSEDGKTEWPGELADSLAEFVCNFAKT